MEADLANINKIKIIRAKIINLLNILYKVIKKRALKIINRLLKNRAPGLNSIINKVIYIVTPLILKELAQAVIKYLIIGFSRELKKLFTLVLRKEEKKNYLLLSAYRFIALENILIKLAEKVLTIYIVRKVKVKILLL